MLELEDNDEDFYNRLIPLNYDLKLEQLKELTEEYKVITNKSIDLRKELKEKALIKEKIDELFKVEDNQD